MRSFHAVTIVALAVAAAAFPGPSSHDGLDQWPSYGGDPGGSRYSPHAQIRRDNVSRLVRAWSYKTGERGQGAREGAKLTFEATPILVDGRLYLSTAFGKVIALDPTTGRELWTFDPTVDRQRRFSEVTSRGVSAWRDPRAAVGAPCGLRVFAGTIDARLFALDGATGRPCAGFGVNGVVDLTQGVKVESPADYQVTSPPALARETVVVGSSIGDNWHADTGSGVVRGFDARTGALRWAWHPLAPGGRAGAANTWSVISADPERDLVFLPTTSPSPDFRSEGIYTPPSLRGTIMWPGNGSGTNWGSAAFDRERRLLVLNTARLMTLVQLLPREGFDAARAASQAAGEDWEYGRQREAPYGMRRRTLLSSKGLPCHAPPWGTLAAVALDTGEVRWEVPLGGVPDGHPLKPALGDGAIGLPNGGGPVVTAGGLVFIGAAFDQRLRAFDVETGRELWSASLPFAGIATPMTYVGSDGRQYVVIAAGGHGKSNLALGDEVVAFALPAR